MSDETPDDTQASAADAGGRFEQFFGPADTEVRSRLADAVTVVGERSGDLRSQLETLGRQAAEAAGPVLESVEDHLEENDIDVTIADNEIHVEGDEAGLSKVEADLKDTVQGSNLHLEYDRESGITVDMDDGDTDPDTEQASDTE